MLERMTFETFAAHRGDTFMVRLGDGVTIPLTLAETTNSMPGVPSSSGLGESFSLIFLGPRDRPLSQGTYEFAHEALGQFPIFITAVGMGEDGMQYEAVFTRLPPDSDPTP